MDEELLALDVALSMTKREWWNLRVVLTAALWKRLLRIRPVRVLLRIPYLILRSANG